MEIKKRSNMRDVARLAGVSVATVSRVMNGTAGVSQESDERVRRAIQTLQFVPSPAARSINSGRTHMVGALVPTLAHEIFARFLNEVEDGLSEAGLSLVVATTDYDADKEFRRARDLLNVGVEALVVSGLDHSAEFDAIIALHRVPLIAISRFSANAVMPTIGYDNAAAAQSALMYLTALGHREIAVVVGPLASNDRTRERVRGLKDISPQISVTETGLSMKEAIDTCTQLLQTTQKVTAILGLTDIVAQGALVACKRAGVRVPQDVSVIGIDDLPSSAYTEPPLTSVHLPVGRMGEMTAQAIVGWLEHGVRSKPIKIESHMVERASVAPPKVGRGPA